MTASLLATAYRGFEVLADRYADAVLRADFPTAPPASREICAAWATAQAGGYAGLT